MNVDIGNGQRQRHTPPRRTAVGVLGIATWVVLGVANLAGATGLMPRLPMDLNLYMMTGCVAIAVAVAARRAGDASDATRDALARMNEQSIKPVREAFIHGYRLRGEHCRQNCGRRNGAHLVTIPYQAFVAAAGEHQHVLVGPDMPTRHTPRQQGDRPAPHRRP